MAGFAVFMTILMFGFFGLIGAVVCSLVLTQVAKRRFARVPAKYRWMRARLALAPFAAVLWVAVAFVCHVFISNNFAHQDCGLGMSPDPFVTLPNGYRLGSHNTYDGYIVAPGFSTDAPVSGPGYVRSIVSLRIDGNEARGTLFDFKASRTRPFLLNMKTHEFQTDAQQTNDRLCDSKDASFVKVWGVANDEAQTSTASYWVLYRENRRKWPDYEFLFLIICGECALSYYVYGLLRRPPVSDNGL